jgi:hypothetical protein
MEPVEATCVHVVRDIYGNLANRLADKSRISNCCREGHRTHGMYRRGWRSNSGRNEVRDSGGKQQGGDGNWGSPGAHAF